MNEFVFTVITMFFFHFSFSGIKNDSSNDLLMAWEQTASGHPCIVFFQLSLFDSNSCLQINSLHDFRHQPLLMSNDLRDIDARSRGILLNT